MAEPLPPAQCVVDGESFLADGEAYVVVDPYREEPMGSTPEAGEALVGRAVASGARAAAAWVDADLEERAALLERVAELLERDSHTVAGLVSREMGMPLALANITQSQVPAGVLRATARAARSFPWREEIEGAVLLRRGAGVVGAVTPWNMPVHQIIAKVSSALAAGCSVVLKGSEQTPYDAHLVAMLFLEAGAAPGLVNVVTGTGPETGAALSAHPGLARMSFTGSVRAGREVATLAAASLTPCALELGGKSPAVILPDADLAQVVPAAFMSGLTNSGQACNAPTRMLVPRTSLAEVEELIVAAAASVRLGDPSLPETQQGPLVTSRQRAAVLSRIQDALRDGGRLVVGTGEASEQSSTGYFVDPTVIADLPEKSAAVREEIFGPVIVLQTYQDEEDAVRLANDSDYGLSAEVWSGDHDHAIAVGERLSCGQVKINGVRTRQRLAVPFGGMRHSGYGRELGAAGIEEFTDTTAVMA